MRNVAAAVVLALGIVVAGCGGADSHPRDEDGGAGAMDSGGMRVDSGHERDGGGAEPDVVVPPADGGGPIETECMGTVTPCSELTIAPCMVQIGCSWTGSACEGRAVPCEEIAEDDCFLQPGCSLPALDAGMPDAGPPPVDAGPPPADSGAPPMDAGSPPVDAGPPPADGGTTCTPPEGPVPYPGCNPDDGIECDGDWRGRCEPACAATQCCSPQRNRFACVPRLPDGGCPAADLWVDDTRLDPYIEYRTFAADSCSIMEGCVGGPGTRRLLRFDTWTPNTGGADMFLGAPSRDVPYFEYSSCHRHYHFNSYAEYELLTSDERCVAATGHKQAFCLLDYYDYPCDPTGRDPAVPDCRRIAGGYTCGNQGIRRDAQDVYDASLDCQWIDITDVPPGDYVIRIRINTEHILNESDYTNNEVRVPFTVPADATDITVACDGRVSSATRDCGWRLEGMHTCTAGEMVRVACSARCGLGMCTGDPILRVCDTTEGVACTARVDLATNDDSGCPGGGTDYCSQVRFTCPASGSYNVFRGSYDTSMASTCTVATMP